MKKVDGRLAREDIAPGHTCRTKLEKDWFNNLRMDQDACLQLLSVVWPSIISIKTLMWKSISAHERPKATLMFLATGQIYYELKYTTWISAQLLGKIVPETCKSICTSLQEKYMCISGIRFYNYKGSFSKVLMAIVNSNYEFIMNNFGMSGNVSDDGLTGENQFYHSLSEKCQHILPSDFLSDSLMYLLVSKPFPWEKIFYYLSFRKH